MLNRNIYTFPTGSEGWTESREEPSVPRVGEFVNGPDHDTYKVRNVTRHPWGDEEDVLPYNYIVLRKL